MFQWPGIMVSHSPVSTAARQLTPVTPQERVQLFDVLRGFALFGVLWSNLNDSYRVAKAATPFAHALQWMQSNLVQDRFYSLLGFLFGIGFAIQLTRAAQRGQDVRDLFLRRMAVLLGIGLVHATLIWNGDILVQYALTGFALVLFRHWAPRKLLLAALALWLFYSYLMAHLAWAFQLNFPKVLTQLGNRSWQADVHGTWAQSVGYGAVSFLHDLYAGGLLGSIGAFLALFILGLWAVRVDLIARLTRRRSTILWTLVGAGLCWAGFVYVNSHLPVWWPPPSRPSSPGRLPGVPRTLLNPMFWWWPRVFVNNIIWRGSEWSSAAVYALTFAFVMSYRSAAKRLERLAALGRMTLTTYLTQSVVCTTIFYNWGFGLINKATLTGLFLFALALFALQVVVSVWWLRRYQFGPAEWLWRSLAYGRRLPLRIASTQAAPAGVVASNG